MVKKFRRVHVTYKEYVSVRGQKFIANVIGMIFHITADIEIELGSET